MAIFLIRFWALVAFTLILSSCFRESDYRFEVFYNGLDVVSAHIELCGARHRMEKQSRRFLVERPFPCEGSGNISVLLSTGETVDCPIGYIAPGSELLQWRYRLSGKECRLWG